MRLSTLPQRSALFSVSATLSRFLSRPASFDLVTAINTIHNLALPDCKQALKEIQRVSQGHAFIVVDAWRTAEQERMSKQWVLTAKTYMHVDDWVNLFREVGYTGDYYWFFFE